MFAYYEATTITVDDIKQEKTLYNEAVENGTINDTTEKDKLDAKEEAIQNTLENTDQKISDALKT